MSRFLNLLDSSSGRTVEHDKNDQGLRSAKPEIRPKRQKHPSVVSDVFVVSPKSETTREQNGGDADVELKNIQPKVDSHIITTGIDSAPTLYDKNDKNDQSPPCALCGAVIFEHLSTSWGRDPVHRGCGERAF